MTLAHAGGIPEVLSVVVPIALAVVLLRIGARKQRDAGRDRAVDDHDPGDDVSS